MSRTVKCILSTRLCLLLLLDPLVGVLSLTYPLLHSLSGTVFLYLLSGHEVNCFNVGAGCHRCRCFEDTFEFAIEAHAVPEEHFCYCVKAKHGCLECEEPSSYEWD